MSEIIKTEIADAIGPLFLTYAKEVIEDRAIPRINDGLKPVQRRILYDMFKRDNTVHHPYVKCAKTVGSVIGTTHPHGDQSVYDALVHMSQDFSQRYPLIDFHGNCGSWTGKPAAAYRYTNARLSAIGELLFDSIDKNTIDTKPNFDETTEEPISLGGYFPNLMANGTQGIAVGMATNVPPHYVGDVYEAALSRLDDRIHKRETDINNLIRIIKGPDFPTGGIITNPQEMADIYRNGRGRITLRGKYRIENKTNIVFYEVPYKINYESLIAQIVKLGDKFGDIKDIRSESSSRDGVRLIIELKKNASTDLTLNRLFKYTDLQTNIPVNCTLISSSGAPIENVNLLTILDSFINVSIRTYENSLKYDTARKEERKKIVDAILKANERIDDVIRIIKEADEPIDSLMRELSIDEDSARTIFEMRINRVAKASVSKLTEERNALIVDIEHAKLILVSDTAIARETYKKIKSVKESKIFKDDSRRTEIQEMLLIDDIDLIEEKPVVFTYTSNDRVKIIPVSEFNTSVGATKGSRIKLRDGETLREMMTVSNKDLLLCISDTGRAHPLRVYKIPEDSRTTNSGDFLSSLLDLEEGEHIVDVVPYNLDDDTCVTFVTRSGIIKRIGKDALKNIATRPSRVITFNDNDSLASIFTTKQNDHIVILSSGGKYLRVDLNAKNNAVRAMGKTARGIRGMNVGADSVIAATVVDETKSYVTISERGYVKRNDYGSMNPHGRGTRGQAIKCRQGDILIGAVSVSDTDTLVIATEEGKISNVPVKRFRIHGVTAAGNIGMKLEPTDRVISIAVRGENDGE